MIGVDDRKFVVLGDADIDAKVTEGFWGNLLDVM